MAAPPDMTVRSLSGKFTMSDKLSDGQTAFFTLQGLSWVTRKALSYATVTLVIKEYTSEDDVVHIDIVSTASGLSSTEEKRVLNWTERDHKDKLFGQVRGRSQFIKREDFKSNLDGATEEDTRFLLGEKLKDGTASAFLVDEFVQSVVTHQDGGGWSAEQIWGFEEINGERRYTRRVMCKKGDKTEMMRLVYDYDGPSD